MIRIEGERSEAHDPKLKLPLVASRGARAAVDRTVNTGETVHMHHRIVSTVDAVELRAAIVALTARVDEQDAKIAALMAGMTKVTEVTEIVTRDVTRDVTAAVPRNADTRSAADRQRAYRERQKATAKP